MKSLFTTLVLLFMVGFASGQTYYKAVQTELYKKDYSTGKWLLSDKNKDVSITIVSEENTISIQAKSPTLIKLYPGSAEELNTTAFYGKRYRGEELKTDTKCNVDIMVHKETKYVVISIIYDDYNLRYFVEPNRD